MRLAAAPLCLMQTLARRARLHWLLRLLAARMSRRLPLSLRLLLQRHGRAMLAAAASDR